MTNKKSYTVHVTFPFYDFQLWQKLVVGLRFRNRFSLGEDVAIFTEKLLEYANKHKVTKISKAHTLYRARINTMSSNGPFELSEMGAPPRELAGHGRLNPKGIPYLYLASDKETAVSEVRPWSGCKITVAEFELDKTVRLINFSKQHLLKPVKAKKYQGAEITWRELITWMFSAPFDPRDDTAYVPTQYLSERIKGAGFDGIIYDSALNHSGYNVTLFDPSHANAKRRMHAEVKSINIVSRYKDIVENEC